MAISPFDECSVLIPASTLEDFPTDLSDEKARGLLAAWTVLWHPRLLAATKQSPTWYRADSPPEPDGPRVVAIADVCNEQLPKNFRRKCEANDQCILIDGDDRREMLEQLDLEPCVDLEHEGRTISVDDFFAAGYTILQIQVMTRRLRYTSNLDELYLQSRIVEAAQAFLGENAEESCTALHDVFDCLAEERDHYFSSDPHLVDLTLLTPSVLKNATKDGWLERLAASLPEIKRDEIDEPKIRPHHKNMLIDSEVAKAISEATKDQYGPLKKLIVDEKLGWAGGGPNSEICFDALTFQQAEAEIFEGRDFAKDVVGMAPAVYARLSGATPGDLTGALVRAGFVGMIPIDFLSGSGFGDESKVLQQAGGEEIESLTAKPIDANSDAEFLTLGARLGESIDGGEIATALLAHWPGLTCESFRDLCRTATWSVVLGGFWKLDDYFQKGEQPYHLATLKETSQEGTEFLRSIVQRDGAKSIESFAKTVREQVVRQTVDQANGLADTVQGKSSGEPAKTIQHVGKTLAKALGASVDDFTNNNSPSSSVIAVNPNNVGCRIPVVLGASPQEKSENVFGVSRRDSSSFDVSLDVTALGFSVCKAGSSSSGTTAIWKRVFGGGPKSIADGLLLANEFMAVSIDKESGGVSSVYSGGERGNRFSLRMVLTEDGPTTKSTCKMICENHQVVSNSPAEATILCEGKVEDAEGTRKAAFRLCYTLVRGSRLLTVTGSVSPQLPASGDPWKHYLAMRAAVANESAMVRSIVRDKIHRLNARRLVSPLGVVIDEAERQTLVASHGFSFHRCVGDRFVDSLITTAGKDQNDAISFQFSYGFDTPNPVATAQSLIAPPVVLALPDESDFSGHGWLAHVAPTDVNLLSMTAAERREGEFSAIVRVINTRPQPKKVTLRFCRPIEWARPAGVCDDGNRHDLEPLDDDNPVNVKDDVASFAIAGHGVEDVLVVFGSGNG